MTIAHDPDTGLLSHILRHRRLLSAHIKLLSYSHEDDNGQLSYLSDVLLSSTDRMAAVLPFNTWARKLLAKAIEDLGLLPRRQLMDVMLDKLFRAWLQLRANRHRRFSLQRQPHAIFYNAITTSMVTERVWPLSRDEYDRFAVYVWEKRGKPKYGKRRITGVHFGMPTFEVNSSSGRIIKQTVGVYPQRDQNGKVFVQMTVSSR